MLFLQWLTSNCSSVSQILGEKTFESVLPKQLNFKSSPMYLGVHRKTLTEMQKLVFQCTRGSTGIFLYERPTINKMTLKYELILWIAFRDPWSPFNYNPEKLYNSDNHTSVKMYPVKISPDGSIQLLVLTESEINRNYYTPYTTQHAEVFKTNCLKTLRF